MRCGRGSRSCAGTTRSCTTSGSWAVRNRPTPQRVDRARHRTRFEAARYALGDTLRFAQEVQLAAMTPQADASSTGYALVDPGREYLVLQPVEKGGSFTVTLEAGTYAPQWHDLTTRETRSTDQVTVERDARASFLAPFE